LALSRFYISAGITGSVITATILKPKSNPTENDTLSAEEIRMFCGVNDCPDNNISYNANLDLPSSKTVSLFLINSSNKVNGHLYTDLL
jgi:hypothetical protein